MFEGKALRRIALVYLGLQVIIWVKSSLFFLWFGHGSFLLFPNFPVAAEIIQADYFFHEAMHVAIGVLAVLFGIKLRRIEWNKLAAAVVIAVFLHNLFYWFTFAHPSPRYSVVDFFTDAMVLTIAILIGFGLKRLLKKRGQKN